MIEGYKTKDMKPEKTKTKQPEDGVIFQKGDMWCFHWGTSLESFTKQEFAKVALSNLSNT